MELLMVIAIIGILVTGVIQIDFNSMAARQKRDRFANAIVSLFRNEITKNSTGKAIKPVLGSSTFIFPTKTLVVLDSDEIRTEYYSGSTMLTKNTLVTKPFFGDAKYVLADGTGSSIGGSTTALSFNSGAALVMELQNGKSPALYFSGSSITNYVSAKVRLGFNLEYITVDIDTRNNLVQIVK